MTDITTNIKDNNRLSQWLFNPFRFLAGYKALLLGVAMLLISAFVGFGGNTHFDGVLDVHIAPIEMPLWFFFAEVLIDWICMVIPLLLLGLIFSRSSFRAIDLLGTQALARWPYLISALVMLPRSLQRLTEYAMAKAAQITPAPAISSMDVAVSVFAMIVVITMVIWMVALMYKAYSVSCNIKGARAIATFIAGLVIAEVLSKLAIWLLYERISGTLESGA